MRLSLPTPPSSVRPRAQKAAWRVMYGLANRRGDDPGTAFMNYGYAPQADADADADGRDADPDRFGIALYERVAGAADLAGRDVLEVGCGRGGGAAFVFAHHRPRSMTAVDLSQGGVDRAAAEHGRPGLRFLRADAEHLPFAASSFDAVLNVESCHCYPDVPQFLREVHRVLRPGGVLLLADVRHRRVAAGGGARLMAHSDVAELRAQIDGSPFRLLEEEDITPNVVRALRLDSARKRALIEARIPRYARAGALDLAAVEGTRTFAAFDRGDETYLRFVLQRA